MTAFAQASSDGAFTDYDKMVETYFPTNFMMRTNVAPTAREAQIINAFRFTLIKLIETTGSLWFAEVAGTSGTPELWNASLME